MDKKNESITIGSNQLFKGKLYTAASISNSSFSPISVDNEFLEQSVKQVLEDCLDDDLNIVLNFLRKKLETVMDNPNLIFGNSDIQNKIMDIVNDIVNQLEGRIDTLENEIQTLNGKLSYLETLIYNSNSHRSINTTTTALPNSMDIQF